MAKRDQTTKAAVTMELAFECPSASQICSPMFDAEGTLFVASQASGEILSASADSHLLRPWGNSFGSPCSLVLDTQGNLYAADLAHAAVVNVEPGAKQQQIHKVVKEYESRPFKGPSSLAFDKNGTLFFTDSGPLGDTTLQNPCGSVYAITQTSGSGQMLQPLLADCLAHPCGIAVCPVTECVYVTEMLRNRVLRFAQRPGGVYHCSVFHTFTGGLGPSAITIDDRGLIFVALYDFSTATQTKEGTISVIHAKKGLMCTIALPSGPEVSGITLSPCQTQLYATEASSNTVYNCSIPDISM